MWKLENVKLPSGFNKDRISVQELQDIISGKYQEKELEKKTNNPFQHTTKGRRADLDNIYFRSAMEANMARYYNYMGIKWEYEPMEFKFPIERGIRFYKPDFYLPDEDLYIECKGWYDPKSKTRMKRMKKYYPDVKVQIIQWEEYKDIEKSVAMLIPEWEYPREKSEE